MAPPTELHRSVSIFLGLLIGFCVIGSSDAYKFYVGGREGWVKNPKQDYSHWAGRTRFSVNDALHFHYKKGDSVLLVSHDDFSKCNPYNPIKNWVDGSTEFTLDRSGSFFFIGGTESSCKNGQRLIVNVLAAQPSQPPSIQPPSPSPLAPRGPGPIAPSPWSPPPQGPSPRPASPAPLAPQPHGLSPTPHSPLPPPPSPAVPPHSAPTPTSAPSPVATPPKGPSPAAPTTVPAPQPPTPPAQPPLLHTPTTPDPTPKNSSTHASAPEPAPAHSSAWVVSPMSVCVLAGTLVFSGLIMY